MNIVEAFKEYFETLTGSTFEQDLYISGAPSSNKAPDNIWWLVASGGSPTANASSENLKSYQIDIYRRHLDPKTLYDELQSLEEDLNCAACISIEGYDVVDTVATTFPVDNDLDDERRKVGLLQLTITTYKSCEAPVS